jgi:hypothetical protein
MLFEISDEVNPETGAKRVLVYEDDGVTLVMLSEKLYEGDEDLELMKIFEYCDSDSDSDCNGPTDG